MRKDLQEQVEAAKEEIKKELKDVEPVVYTQTAIGIYKDSKIGLWFLSEFNYNPQTGNVSALIKHGPYEDRTMAIEHFKIKAANLDLVG